MSTAPADRKLRVGVFGCGPIVQAAHFGSCCRAHNAELYTICDAAEGPAEPNDRCP